MSMSTYSWQVHCEILRYCSMHLASTLVELLNLIVQSALIQRFSCMQSHAGGLPQSSNFLRVRDSTSKASQCSVDTLDCLQSHGGNLLKPFYCLRVRNIPSKATQNAVPLKTPPASFSILSRQITTDE